MNDWPPPDLEAEATPWRQLTFDDYCECEHPVITDGADDCGHCRKLLPR